MDEFLNNLLRTILNIIIYTHAINKIIQIIAAVCLAHFTDEDQKCESLQLKI